MSRIEAQIFDGSDTLARFAEDWERVFRASACEPSTSFEWTQGLARHHLDPGDRLSVARLQRAGEVVGFVPLVGRTIRVFRVPCVRLMPASEIFNTHSDLLLGERPGEAIDALFDVLHTSRLEWACLRMSKLLDQNPLGSLLESRARARGWTCHVRPGRASYHLPLPRTFEDYLAARSAKFRNHARRAEKKLRTAGELRVVEITGPAEFLAAYTALLHIEESSWKESEGVSIHAVSRQTAFYREWGQAAAAAGRLHVQLLTLDGEPIAHNLGYVCGGCYYYLKTSYAAERRPLGPATFLRLRLVESLMARGINAIDFPGTPFEWERQWTDAVRVQKVVSIYPGTLRGRMLAWRDSRARRSHIQ